MTALLRTLLALGLLLVGALVGVATVAVHAWWWGTGLAVVASLGAVLALPPGWSTRVAFTVGWAVPLGLGLTARAEGDYLVAATAQGYTIIALGLILIVLSLGTVPARPGWLRQRA